MKSKKWTGVRYYGPPKYVNKMLLFGIFGKIFELKIVKEDQWIGRYVGKKHNYYIIIPCVVLVTNKEK